MQWDNLIRRRGRRTLSYEPAGLAAARVFWQELPSGLWLLAAGVECGYGDWSFLPAA